ncbi:Uncharacterized protein SCF082_LOCUS52712, partial [Durusdinium trenchii]
MRNGVGAGLSCIAASLTLMVTLSPYILWTGWGSTSTNGTGPFVLSRVNVRYTLSGRTFLLFGTTSYGDLDDTVCNDSNFTVTLAGQNLTFNNYETFGETYGFCEAPNGTVTVPSEASTIQAMIVLTFLFATATSLLLCCGTSFRLEKYLAPVLAFAGTIFSIVTFSTVASWNFFQDLRAGSGVLPVQVTTTDGLVTFVGLPQESFVYGPSFVALVFAFIFLLLTTLTTCRRSVRNPVVEDIDDLSKPREGNVIVEVCKRAPMGWWGAHTRVISAACAHRRASSFPSPGARRASASAVQKRGRRLEVGAEGEACGGVCESREAWDAVWGARVDQEPGTQSHDARTPRGRAAMGRKGADGGGSTGLGMAAAGSGVTGAGPGQMAAGSGHGAGHGQKAALFHLSSLARLNLNPKLKSKRSSTVMVETPKQRTASAIGGSNVALGRDLDVATRDLYEAFVNAEAKEKRTIKVDLCPSVSAHDVEKVFHDVARFCGFAGVKRVNEQVLLMCKLTNHATFCGPNSENHFEFTVLQELVVREYGLGSAKYATLFLSWVDATPKLVREGSGQNFKDLIAQGMAQALGKKLRVSKKGTQLLIEEIVGRWRATLFQREYALEAAALDNHPDAPWQSLNPEEVDYEDSDDEEGSVSPQHATSHGSSREPNDSQTRAVAHVGDSLASMESSQSSAGSIMDLPAPPPPPPKFTVPLVPPPPPPRGFGEGFRVGFLDDVEVGASSRRPKPKESSSMSELSSSVGRASASGYASSGGAGNSGRDLRGVPGSSQKRANSYTLIRPKSAMKFPHDKCGINHDKRKPLSVQFDTNKVQVQELDISRIHREARMGAGCRATNQFGQVRPLTSTRTG